MCGALQHVDICSLAKGCNPTSLNCVNLTFKGMPLKPLLYFMSAISYKEAYLKLDQNVKLDVVAA